MKKALIFSGYNLRAVIALCRLLSQSEITPCIIAKDNNDPIFKTEYAKWVVYIRTELSLDISVFEGLANYYSGEKPSVELVLMPTTEHLNRFALNNQLALLQLGISIPLVTNDLYCRLSDKAAFQTLCKENDISVPKTVPYQKGSIPFVAKQKCFEHGGEKQAKPYIIKNTEDFIKFEQSENPDLYFYEEYVEGESIYLMLFIDELEVISFAQKNILQQDLGGSMIAAVNSDFQVSALAEHVSRVLKKVGFYGVVMIEFRANQTGSYMIEANPRLWGPLQFCIDNIPRLIWSFLKSCDVLPEELAAPKARKADYYFWSGGWQKDLAVSRQIKYHPGSENVQQKIIPEMLRDDVFCREDTMSLFLAELNKECFT